MERRKLLIGGAAGATAVALSSVANGPVGAGRTLLGSRLADGVNIKSDFGAVGGGADDTAAFVAFRSWAQAQTGTVHLLMPPDDYVAPEGPNFFAMNAVFVGIKKLIVSGYGASLLTTGQLCGRGVLESNLHSARFATVSAGSTTIQLVTAAQHSRFAVNQWIMLAQIDLMSQGFPPNPCIFEYVQIASINTDTGLITLTAPIVYDYFSTYPSYATGGGGAGGNMDHGGPATAYAIPEDWNCDVTLKGLHFPKTEQHYSGVRKFTGIDLTVAGKGLIPTGCKEFSMNGYTQPTPQLEVDKMASSIIWRNSSFQQVIYQSANDTTLIEDCVFGTDLNGTSKHITIRDTAIAGKMTFGPTSFGAARTAVLENVSASSVVASRNGQEILNKVEFLAGGQIRVIRLGVQAVRMAVPGHKCYFFDNNAAANIGIPFTITDIWRDATYTYIETTGLESGIPAAILAHATHIVVHPAPSVTATNTTGCAAMEDLCAPGRPAGSPIYSYSKRTYGPTLSHFTSPATRIQWGRFVRLTVDVTRAYTGAQANCRFHPFGTFGTDARLADGTKATRTKPNPRINLKVAGTRVIEVGSITGDRAGDAGLTFPDCWMSRNHAVNFLDSMSGDTEAQRPIVTVTVETDQDSRPV